MCLLASSAASRPHIEPSPSWDVHRHQGLEKTPVIGNSKMKQFVGDHEILEAIVFINKIRSKCNGASR